MQSSFTMSPIVLCKIQEAIACTPTSMHAYAHTHLNYGHHVPFFLSFGRYWSTLARDLQFAGIMVC